MAELIFVMRFIMQEVFRSVFRTRSNTCNGVFFAALDHGQKLLNSFVTNLQHRCRPVNLKFRNLEIVDIFVQKAWRISKNKKIKKFGTLPMSLLVLSVSSSIHVLLGTLEVTVRRWNGECLEECFRERFEECLGERTNEA